MATPTFVLQPSAGLISQKTHGFRSQIICLLIFELGNILWPSQPTHQKKKSLTIFDHQASQLYMVINYITGYKLFLNLCFAWLWYKSNLPRNLPLEEVIIKYFISHSQDLSPNENYHRKQQFRTAWVYWNSRQLNYRTIDLQLSLYYISQLQCN